ncbi:MAG: glycosyltransferase family 2 protein [Nanoarchaeota archaeon]|nr:glycosyltransferase family 2 protein [Nanoarchaeota archaeon]
MEFSAKEMIVERDIIHVSGKSKLDTSSSEVNVICLVKDGGDYIKPFIDYYFTIGTKHVVLLDNNSQDNSLTGFQSDPRISIFQCNLPFKEFECEMRSYLIKTLCKNRWCLNVDIDEYFDYPHSNKVSLNNLIEYLKNNSYSAVVANMLDMFSERGLESIKGSESVKARFNHYDLTNLEKIDYQNNGYFAQHFSKFYGHNAVSNKNIQFILGGIRKTIFKGGKFLLTKHPLIFIDDKIQPVSHPHFVNNARLADFSAVLFHYKFVKGFKEKINMIINNRDVPNISEYELYHKLFASDSKFEFKQDSSKRLNDDTQLIEEGFLITSDEYERFCKIINKKGL